ncbi:MAG: XRE family transcriptional regulator [Rickettsiales bacterium]|nr:MAG: XRE family transcriptional regulator [Rickettsiales bacterium]
MENNIKYELIRLMDMHDFNMKSLSVAAGLNETAIRDIIKGRVKNPRIDTLQKIAKVLNCSIGDLLGINS